MLRRFATASLTKGGETFIDLEYAVGAHNYHPLPVVLKRGKGVYVYDTSGKRYLDFLAAYSAVNHGHCHPEMLKTLRSQSRILTITSRAFFSNILGETLKMLTSTFGMDRAIMMNTGCEAVETAVKLARRWGYEVKNIPKDQATVVFCTGNFWGRSLAACGSSDDPDRYHNFGPFAGLNFNLVPYNNIPALEEALRNPNVSGFVFEPIQGEAGVCIPDDGYLKRVRELCTKYNVLMIADEVQTGLGRCGQLLACDWEGVKPDVVALGKSLSGGILPASATLAREDVMKVLVPNSHGSTYGGSPLAAKLAQTAITIMKEENFVENARVNGEEFRKQLATSIGSVVMKVRGKGMMSAIEIDPKVGAWNFCLKLAKKGLLAKPTHEHIVRLTPPLVITKQELAKSAEIIAKVAKSF